MSLFKRKPIEQIKQPQEYYCSNINCTNDVAQFSSLSKLLTNFAFNNYADFYCIDCIIERKINA